MYEPTLNDHVHDRSNPIVLGAVTKVLKTRVHVWFASGCGRAFTRVYDMRHARKFLVRESGEVDNFDATAVVICTQAERATLWLDERNIPYMRRVIAEGAVAFIFADTKIKERLMMALVE